MLNRQFNGNKQLSVTLYLLNKKGLKVLQNICEQKSFKSLINAVVSAKDKGNKEDCYEEIKKLCFNNSISFFNKGDVLDTISDYSIAIGWRWLIYDHNLLIVLHDSLLPKYRGFSPLVNMLINGENKIGVTAIFASKKMDEGDIIDQKSVDVVYPLKIGKAIDILVPLYVSLVNSLLTKIVQKEKIISSPQNESEATYSIWRNEDDYFIDWSKNAEEVKKFVDAVGYPYGGAKTKIDENLEIRILECRVLPNIVLEIPGPGKVLMMLDHKPVVLCGKGAVLLKELRNADGEIFELTKLRTKMT